MIAYLKARLGLDSAGFKTGLKQSADAGKSFESRIKSIGKAVGIAFSATAVIGMGKALMSWASDISHAARNVGLLSEEMLAITRATEQAGSQTREVQNVLARFNQEVNEAIYGGKELKKAYTDLGLSVENLVGVDDYTRVQMLARAITESVNPTAAIYNLFGAEGVNMRSGFEAIANGLDEVSASAGGAVDAVERMDTALVKLKSKAYENIANALFGEKGKSPLDRGFGAAGNFGRLVRMFTAESEQESQTRAVDASLERAKKAASEREAAARALADAEKEADAAKIEAAQKQWTRLQAMQRENEKLENSRLEGIEKLEAEHAQAQADIVEQMKTATRYEQGLLRERASILESMLAEEVAAHRAAEDAKVSATREAQEKMLTEQITRARERAEAEQSRIRGTGVETDSMARMGGFTGGERPGLALADRQIKVAQEQTKLLAEIKPLVAQLRDIGLANSDTSVGGL